MFGETCCPWSHGLRPKKLSVRVAVPPAPVRVPIQRPFAPSVASVTSVTNDKGDNNDPGGCAPIFCHLPYSWGKSRKTSARRPSDEGTLPPVIASNRVPYLQMRSVGPHSTQEWRGKERTGSRLSFYLPLCYNSRARCFLLQLLRTKNAVIAGAHSYFVV